MPILSFQFHLVLYSSSMFEFVTQSSTYKFLEQCRFMPRQLFLNPGSQKVYDRHSGPLIVVPNKHYIENAAMPSYVGVNQGRSNILQSAFIIGFKHIDISHFILI